MSRRSRSHALFAAFALTIVTGAGCSTPRTASGTLDEGKERVEKLVLEAAAAIPGKTTFRPPTLVGSQACRKTVAGYVIGKTGARRAEVPLIVYTPDGASAQDLLEDIAAEWSGSGYELDRSRFGEDRFPQLRATTPDGYDVYATSLVRYFDIKNPGEQYTDYVRRAKLAGVETLSQSSWDEVPVGRKLKDVEIATQIDLYAVSQCLRDS